jgi:hypothetical protein
MRWFVLALPLSLAACASAVPESQRNQTIKEIEQHVHLPATAANLDQYARYYAQHGSRVVGIYIMTVVPNTRADLPTGQARWIADENDLPEIMDGGCSMIRVVYDPRAKTIESVGCNGYG